MSTTKSFGNMLNQIATVKTPLDAKPKKVFKPVWGKMKSSVGKKF